MKQQIQATDVFNTLADELFSIACRQGHIEMYDAIIESLTLSNGQTMTPIECFEKSCADYQIAIIKNLIEIMGLLSCRTIAEIMEHCGTTLPCIIDLARATKDNNIELPKSQEPKGE